MSNTEHLRPSEVVFNGKVYDCNDGATYYKLEDVWDRVHRKIKPVVEDSVHNQISYTKTAMHHTTGIGDSQPTGDK